MINDDPLDTSMGFASSYSKDSDILDKTINCQDNFIGFSGTYLSDFSSTYLSDLSATFNLINPFITYDVWISEG